MKSKKKTTKKKHLSQISPSPKEHKQRNNMYQTSKKFIDGMPTYEYRNYLKSQCVIKIFGSN